MKPISKHQNRAYHPLGAIVNLVPALYEHCYSLRGQLARKNQVEITSAL